MKKILVFAHVPPPHHGQSVMVEQLLSVLRESESVELYHVNACYSDSIDTVGTVQLKKGLLAFRYCCEALRLKVKHGVDTIYYVPAPSRRAALYRDWVVMACLRLWFRNIIFHWHSVGLGAWIACKDNSSERAKPFKLESFISCLLLGRVEHSVVLNEWSKQDAAYLMPKRMSVVRNGIPDPCPGVESLLALRKERLQVRGLSNQSTRLLKVLFIGHCTHEKGVVDTIRGVALANEQLSNQGAGLSIQLTISGSFIDKDEEGEILDLIKKENATNAKRYDHLEQNTWDMVNYVGFSAGQAKEALFVQHDVLCFPTYYPYEGLPLVIIEALAFAMPVVTTNWRALPEVIKGSDLPICSIKKPQEVADALRVVSSYGQFEKLRELYQAEYSSDAFKYSILQALLADS